MKDGYCSMKQSVIGVSLIFPFEIPQSCSGNVDAWVRNDYLGFEMLYVFKGVVSKRPPGFTSTKDGQPLGLDKRPNKRVFLNEWIKPSMSTTGFGKSGDP